MTQLWVPSKDLHLPPVRLSGFLLEVGAWDCNHYLFRQERLLCRSPVKQFLQTILGCFRWVDQAGVVDTGGTTRTLDVSDFGNGILRLDAAANTSLYGIVIGTDNTPVDITNSALVAQITHGTGAGQMVHQIMQFDTQVTVVDPNCTFATWRNFNNNSGGSIVVRETGIYVITRYVLTSQGVFLIARDIPTSVTVPDGGGCYVKYTLQITE